MLLPALKLLIFVANAGSPLLRFAPPLLRGPISSPSTHMRRECSDKQRFMTEATQPARRPTGYWLSELKHLKVARSSPVRPFDKPLDASSHAALLLPLLHAS